MIYVLTPQEMRDADSAASAASADVALMRNAGTRIAEYVRRVRPDGGRIVAFVGPGNNGGDAFAAFAELGRSYERIVYAARSSTPSAARTDAEQRARASGIAVRPLPDDDASARAALDAAALALDALFGTGSRLPLADEFRAATRALDARKLPVVAIDIPSGIDALTGAVDEDAVRASQTISLAALKPGHLFDPSRENCGEVWLADIGINGSLLAQHARTFAALDDAAFLQMLPHRSATADKRSAGAPLVLAGSQQFPGAAVLCARAAARAGAGYVTVATSAAAAPTLRTHLIEQVVVSLADDTPADAVVDELADIATRNSSLAIGPGLGLDERTGEIVRGVISRIDLPIVLDASALFHLAKHLDILKGKRVVITPHEGEFARLTGKGTIAPGERVERIRQFVNRTQVTTLLKGRATLIYDRELLHVNPTGTNALATAGSGDVLTGIIATLLSQGLSPVDAAVAGAYWHGLAGREAKRERTIGVVAGDLPDALARALPTLPTPTQLRCVLPA
jgi:NAD(P)H-hydrate epimerase